ncbi:hypothetical protein CHN50_21150 [Priestia aryabhattai]|nr:hypothetical protein CHN50_21150 [Priestia aryabhattai]
MKLTNSYKLVSFNVVVVMTTTTKLTNLCYLKTYVLKALDCLSRQSSAFFMKIYKLKYI